VLPIPAGIDTTRLQAAEHLLLRLVQRPSSILLLLAVAQAAGTTTVTMKAVAAVLAG
jgi:hypothetical protein